MKLKEIKNRIAKLKKKEQELLLKEQTIAEFRPLYDTIRANTKQETVNNNILIIRELFKSFDLNHRDGLAGVAQSISDQSKKINSKNAPIVKALEGMVLELAKLEKKNYFDIKEFNQVFTQGLKKVLNVVVDPKEIPNSTTYTRNGNGKITSVLEKFDKKNVKHNWSYNKDGQLIKVTSKVDEVT